MRAFWKRSSSRNTRGRRRMNVLETKLRTRSSSNKRTRKLVVGWCIVFACLLFGWGAWELLQLSGRGIFTTNPNFILRDIVIEHSGTVLTRQEILKHAGIKKGQNLFEIDLKKLRSHLELLPEVKKVEVRRQVPDRLTIRLAERVPVARVTTPRGVRWETYAIDEEGFVMGLEGRDLDDRPLITGAKVSDLRVGNPVVSTEIFQALDLVRKCELTRLNTIVHLESVDVSRSHMLLVQTTDGMRAKIGLEYMDQNLRRLEYILNDARRRGLRVGSADLTVDRDVPVIFRGAV